MIKVLFSLLVALVGLGTAPAAPATPRPHILVVLVDDMGYSDLDCFGSRIRTPNLDGLAAAGLRFRQVYNSAKCEPTRTSLLSGQWWQDVEYGIQRGPTLGHVMQRVGYRTLAVGKWHLEGNPVDVGFDRYFGHLSGGSDYFRGNGTFRLDHDKFVVPKDGSFYTTDAFTDHAIRFMDESLDDHPEQPFFMYLAFNAPHSPLQAWPEDIARYHGVFDAGWDRLRKQRVARLRENGILEPEWPIPERPDTVPAWDTLTPEQQAVEARRMEIYAAMTDRVDQSVGRLMQHLRQRGIADDTLLIFLSDNGANPFDHGRKGPLGQAGGRWMHGLGWSWLSNTPGRFYKRNMHMGGALTSMVVHWPAGIRDAGTVADTPVHIVDLLPTFLELAGRPKAYPPVWDGEETPAPPGRSFVSRLHGRELPARGPLYFHLFDHRAVIAGGYKLVSEYDRPWELYDLANDRFETRNLVGDFPDRAEQLAATWTRWAETRKVPVPFVNYGDEPVYKPILSP